MGTFKRYALYKRVTNYVAVIVIFCLGYKLLWVSSSGQKDKDLHRYAPERNPRNMHQRRPGEVDPPSGVSPPLVLLEGEDLKPDTSEKRPELEQGNNLDAGQEERKDVVRKIDVGQIPRDEGVNPEAKLVQDVKGEERAFQEDLHLELRRGRGHGNSQTATKAGNSGSRPNFHPDGVDWELEEEMKKRRAAFFATVETKKQNFNDSDFKDMHEKDDDFAFVTAGSHSTYPATLEFIFSIQYFYPESSIAVYDIGLIPEEKDYINSLCKAEVVTMWIQMWPESLYNIRHRVWRPLVLQFAMAKFGHYVYVEPGRFVYKQGIRDYIQASRKHGVLFGGRQLKHSSFVVTNPHMYTFLMTNERKLQTIPHFDFSLAVIHNTRRVKHEFMRFLVSCALEEYCIAPPDSKATCDLNLGNNRKYARCHRYDESAINLILNRWHHYQPREYLLRDVITRHFDGRDMSTKVKVCNDSARRDEV